MHHDTALSFDTCSSSYNQHFTSSPWICTSQILQPPFASNDMYQRRGKSCCRCRNQGWKRCCEVKPGSSNSGGTYKTTGGKNWFFQHHSGRNKALLVLQLHVVGSARTYTSTSFVCNCVSNCCKHVKHIEIRHWMCKLSIVITLLCGPEARVDACLLMSIAAEEPLAVMWNHLVSVSACLHPEVKDGFGWDVS